MAQANELRGDPSPILQIVRAHAIALRMRDLLSSSWARLAIAAACLPLVMLINALGFSQTVLDLWHLLGTPWAGAISLVVTCLAMYLAAQKVAQAKTDEINIRREAESVAFNRYVEIFQFYGQWKLLIQADRYLSGAKSALLRYENLVNFLRTGEIIRWDEYRNHTPIGGAQREVESSVNGVFKLLDYDCSEVLKLRTRDPYLSSEVVDLHGIGTFHEMKNRLFDPSKNETFFIDHEVNIAEARKAIIHCEDQLRRKREALESKETDLNGVLRFRF